MEPWLKTANNKKRTQQILLEPQTQHQASLQSRIRVNMEDTVTAGLRGPELADFSVRPRTWPLLENGVPLFVCCFCMWEPEKSLQALVLSFYHMGLRDQTRAIIHDGKQIIH